MGMLKKIVRIAITIIAVGEISGCESPYSLKVIPAISTVAPASQSTPPVIEPPTLTAIPNGSNSGVGVGQGSSGSGNLILFGDEWVTRFANDQSYDWAGVVQANLTGFWNDAFGILTEKTAKKRILLIRFNDSATVWGVTDALDWRNYLPNLDSKYILSNYDASSQGALTSSFLSHYDAVIIISYDPMLSASLLTNYVASGGGVMVLPIGFGVPTAGNASAAYECLGLNSVLTNFPYKFDCGNPNSNFVASGAFSNVNPSASALPFNNGYAVIPSSQSQTPY